MVYSETFAATKCDEISARFTSVHIEKAGEILNDYLIFVPILEERY